MRKFNRLTFRMVKIILMLMKRRAELITEMIGVSLVRRAIWK